jgi:hypothetical protein
MIDRYRKVGDKVVFVGGSDNVEEIPVGAIGVIKLVDSSDAYMTYKVQFPTKDYAVWVDNPDLEIASTEDDEPCGWKTRALKAESELNELKKALKTLSEG